MTDGTIAGYAVASRSTPEIAPDLLYDVSQLLAICELTWVDVGMAIEGPQAAAANGRLPSSVLAPIPGGRLERKAAAAWNAMREHIGKKHNVWIAPGGPNSSYRSYGGQVYFWNLYLAGKGNPAARPGTSNHGWGRAVDVATTQMAYYIRKYMAAFGWSHAEGARVGEWWHFTYVGGYTAPKPAPKRKLAWGKEEKKHIEIVRAKRRIRVRNKNSWKGLSPEHEKQFDISVAWLRARANHLQGEKVKDTEYQARKVTYMRDVALNRNNRGI